MKILVAEDEGKVQKFIQQALMEAGMVVDVVAELEDLESALETHPYDILVLDRLLHGKDSLPLLPKIRKKYSELKILVLSALSEVEDRVEGLSEGADDYLGKPFHVSELVARVRALGRRESKETSGDRVAVLQYEDLRVDLERQQVFRGTEKIDLTGKEFRLLGLLLRHPGRVFSKTVLLDQVWEMNHFPESNVVEVTVANLRNKLDRGRNPLIFSRRGVGYWLGKE